MHAGKNPQARKRRLASPNTIGRFGRERETASATDQLRLKVRSSMRTFSTLTAFDMRILPTGVRSSELARIREMCLSRRA